MGFFFCFNFRSGPTYSPKGSFEVKMASAPLAMVGVLVLAFIAHAAFIPETPVEPEVRELTPDIVDETAVDPAMKEREEEEEEEDEETLLESLRSLLEVERELGDKTFEMDKRARKRRCSNSKCRGRKRCQRNCRG